MEEYGLIPGFKPEGNIFDLLQPQKYFISMYSPVQGRLNNREITVADVDELDRNTTHLSISSYGETKWPEVGAAVCKLEKLQSLSLDASRYDEEDDHPVCSFLDIKGLEELALGNDLFTQRAAK